MRTNLSVVPCPSRRDSRRDLANSSSHIEFRIDGRKMEIVSSYSHLDHIIFSSDGDRLDIIIIIMKSYTKYTNEKYVNNKKENIIIIIIIIQS